MKCPSVRFPRSRAFLWLAIVASVAGCGMGNHPSPRMAIAQSASLAPVPDRATVVFMRPSGYAGVVIPSLFADGRYLGDVEATTKLVVTLPPGKHAVLFGPLDYTAACRKMEVEVEAGKIYFVEATVANGAVLFAARPSDANRLRPWLGVPSRQLDAAKLSVAPVDGSSQSKCNEDADKRWADWSAEDRAKSTLGLADGFTVAP